MYWLIRRTAAPRFASLFYLVAATVTLLVYWLFGEKLDALPMIGMDICVMVWCWPIVLGRQAGVANAAAKN